MGNRTFNWAELKPEVKQVWKLSLPAILTQITTIAMQYIDSAMVGALGATASAAIGLCHDLAVQWRTVCSFCRIFGTGGTSHWSKSRYGSTKCRPARPDQCFAYLRTFVYKRTPAQSSAANRTGR